MNRGPQQLTPASGARIIPPPEQVVLFPIPNIFDVAVFATVTKSDTYAAVQTTMLIAFNAVFFFFPGPELFHNAVAVKAGTLLCVAGLALLMTAVITLRRVIQVAPAPKEGGHLVAAGVYRVLRHPIYTAMVILVVGLFLRRPTLAVAIAGAAVIAFLLVKARFEESLLAAKYPDYATYRARTFGVLLTR